MWSDRRWLSWILLVSVGLRLVAAVILGNQIQPLPGIFDEISYHTLATRLLGGHGFTFDSVWWPITAAGTPTAHWSYLYTLWLTAVYALFGPNPLAARLIQAVLAGTLMPYFTYRLARRVLPGPEGSTQNHGAALLAAGWTAVYGYFVYYTAAIMTEAFFITGILWSLDCAVRLSDRSSAQLEAGQNRADANPWTWVELGLALTVTVYLRQVFLIFVPALLAWLVLVELFRAAGSLRDRVQASWCHLARGVLTATSVLVILLAPATLFNYHQFKRFVLLNTNAGYAFFWANHPIYGDHFVAILPDNVPYTSLIPADLRPLAVNEAALESALMRRGLGFVLADPARYIRLSLSRIPVYFQFWPSADSGLISNIARVGSFGLALPFMVFGLGLWLSDWFRTERRVSVWRSSLLALFIVVFSLIHILSWALTRYRLPVDAVGIIFAGRALDSITRRLLRGRVTHTRQLYLTQP
jgi:hypothetical protein